MPEDMQETQFRMVEPAETESEYAYASETTPKPTPEQARGGVLLGVAALAVLGIGTYLLAGRK